MKEIINEVIHKTEKKFNAFSLRERILICVMFLVIIYFGWYIAFYGYFLATDQDIATKAQQIKSQISFLEGQIDTMSEVLGRNPTGVLMEQAKNLKKENEALTKKIYDNTKKMVSPKNMATILNNIISKTAGLTIVGIESLETKPLFSGKTIIENGKNVRFQVYSHGIRVEMIGGYFETLQFLKTIEHQNENVIWDEISYEVKAYPKAKILIVLHTLSLEEGWIGV